MKRLLWLGAGVALGVLVFRAVSRHARSYTPRGIAAAVAEGGRRAAASVRDFVEDVRAGMREREEEIYEAIEASLSADEYAPDGYPFREERDLPR